MDLSNKTLRQYAEMTCEAFMEDPVYMAVTKNKWLRKIIIREGLLIRMYESRNNGDLFYFDEQGRGLLVLKKADRELQFTEMLKCPNAPVLIPLLPYVIKLMGITGRCDNKGVIGADSYIISPIFVGKEYHNQGVAKNLIKRAAADLLPQGYKIGLDTQNPVNVAKYEKMGFELIKQEVFEKYGINNYYMVLK